MFEPTIPNLLTVFRILLVPVLAAALLSGLGIGDTLAAMVVIAREFAVTGLRQLAMEHGEVVPASLWGKLKTVAQIAMVLTLIAVDDSPAWVDAIVYATVAITVASAIPYFFNVRALVHARPSSHSR